MYFCISVSFPDALCAVSNIENLTDDEEILDAHNKLNKVSGKRSNFTNILIRMSLKIQYSKEK